jgi:small ligand-binding sensory domain FIST
MFVHAHAVHPQWDMALGLVVAQLRAHMVLPKHRLQHGPTPALGLVYITDRLAGEAPALVAGLREAFPNVAHWAGTTGVGILATEVEYWDEPALAVMLCDVPAHAVRTFHGRAPLPSQHADAAVHTALVHADGATPDLDGLIGELADRTAQRVVFGGLLSSRDQALQWAVSGADAQAVWESGLSGVGFGAQVALTARVTQGCTPVGPAHEVTAVHGNVVLSLDNRPALRVLLQDLGLDMSEPARLMPVLRNTLVGLESAAYEGATASNAQERAQVLLARRVGQFGAQTRVRHVIGLDVNNRGVAIGDHALVGDTLHFCRRDASAARADLMRVCAELRDEAEDPDAGGGGLRGAVYVSCAGRGGPHFGAPHAEMKIVRHALGDVPVVGFFAGGEIGYRHLYGYTGVLLAFR